MMLEDVEPSAHAQGERRGQDFGMSVSVVGVLALGSTVNEFATTLKLFTPFLSEQGLS